MAQPQATRQESLEAIEVRLVPLVGARLVVLLRPGEELVDQLLNGRIRAGQLRLVVQQLLEPPLGFDLLAAKLDPLTVDVGIEARFAVARAGTTLSWPIPCAYSGGSTRMASD